LKKHRLIGKGRMAHDFKPLEVLKIIESATADVYERGSYSLLTDLKDASPVLLEAACRALIAADQRVAELETAMAIAIKNKTIRQKAGATNGNA
jgi:hypothetical protein